MAVPPVLPVVVVAPLVPMPTSPEHLGAGIMWLGYCVARIYNHSQEFTAIKLSSLEEMDRNNLVMQCGYVNMAGMGLLSAYAIHKGKGKTAAFALASLVGSCAGLFYLTERQETLKNLYNVSLISYLGNDLTLTAFITILGTKILAS